VPKLKPPTTTEVIKALFY